MAEKFEFLSREWLETLHKKLIEYTAKLDSKLSFGFCESYTNVPRHLTKDGSDKFSFHMLYANGTLKFAAEKNEDVSLVFYGDYQAILPFAGTIVTEANKADYDQRMAEVMRSGKATLKGDPTKIPPELQPLHNAMAAVTK